MLKLGLFVGEENWTFFNEIYEDLSAHFETEVFKQRTYNTPIFYGRLNRWKFFRDLKRLLTVSDVCFFEWTSELLAEATQFPKECRIITRLHSFEIYDWAPKINWDNVDSVILLSKAMQQRFCDLYPKHGHKTVVVHNGISLEKFSPASPRDFQCRLGMLCSINPIKRVYETVLLLYGLHRQGMTTATLHIAGVAADDFRYFASIQSLVDRLGLNGIVTFDGLITDTPTWLKNIDIFISNSFWEGQQTALLEAMATGVYCLSHHWAGAEEILPLENLYFTEEEAKKKITKYYGFSDLRKQDLQTMMRTIACEKFDIERTKTQIRQMISESK